MPPAIAVAIVLTHLLARRRLLAAVGLLAALAPAAAASMIVGERHGAVAASVAVGLRLVGVRDVLTVVRAVEHAVVTMGGERIERDIGDHPHLADGLAGTDPREQLAFAAFHTNRVGLVFGRSSRQRRSTR